MRRRQPIDVQDVIAQARDALTVNRVFGESYEKNDVTVIPVARVQSGAVAEAARTPDGQGRGRGAASA